MGIIGVIILVAFGILIGYVAWYKIDKNKSKGKSGGGSSSVKGTANNKKTV